MTKVQAIAALHAHGVHPIFVSIGDRPGFHINPTPPAELENQVVPSRLSPDRLGGLHQLVAVGCSMGQAGGAEPRIL